MTYRNPRVVYYVRIKFLGHTPPASNTRNYIPFSNSGSYILSIYFCSDTNFAFNPRKESSWSFTQAHGTFFKQLSQLINRRAIRAKSLMKRLQKTYQAEEMVTSCIYVFQDSEFIYSINFTFTVLFVS